MSALSAITETMEFVEKFREEGWQKKIMIVLFLTLCLVILFVDIAIYFNLKNVFASLLVSSVAAPLVEIGISDGLVKNLSISLTATLLILVTMGLLSIKDWLCTSRVGYSWVVERGLCDWDFQGNIVVDENEEAIHIIQSDLGCIIKRGNWRNFDMSFQFKIPSKLPYGGGPKESQLERGFGIIYRAKQLGQYYMLKVDKNGYQPHVRNVLWENSGPVEKATLSTQNLDKWVYAKLSIRDNILTACIGDDQFSFGIPSYSNIQRGVHASEDYEKYKFESLPYAKISFCNAGTVGFRSASLEEVYIRNLTVEPERIFETLIRRMKRWWETKASLFLRPTEKREKKGKIEDCVG